MRQVFDTNALEGVSYGGIDLLKCLQWIGGRILMEEHGYDKRLGREHNRLSARWALMNGDLVGQHVLLNERLLRLVTCS